MGCTSSQYFEDTSTPNNRYYRSGDPNYTGPSAHGSIILTRPEPGMIIVPGLDQPPPQYYPNVHAWNPEPLWRTHPPEPLPHPDEPELYALEIELIDTAITAQELAIERAREAIIAIKANKVSWIQPIPMFPLASFLYSMNRPADLVDTPRDGYHAERLPSRQGASTGSDR